MKRILTLILSIHISLLAPTLSALANTESLLRTKTLISEPATIDRIYTSMQGPMIEQPLSLSETGKTQLLWLRKIKLEIIDGNDYSPLPIEHLCHSHLMLHDSYLYATNNEFSIRSSPRGPALFTMIQGQNIIELPKNFAVPALTNDPLYYSMQVLNLNEIDKPFDVRIRTTLEYLRDEDVNEEMKPLFQTAAILRIPVDETTAQLIRNSVHEGCAINASVANKDGTIEIVPSDTVLQARDGQYYSYHWNVPPGKHTYTYDLLDSDLHPRLDTTIHFASVHLHPYGRSIELFDVTANASVLKVDVKTNPGHGGVDQVNHFSSEKGIPLYKDHQYRLIAEYDNTTDHSVDAMAFLYLYLYDKNFDSIRKERPSNP